MNVASKSSVMINNKSVKDYLKIAVRAKLKAAKLLMRDPRAKERKKPGLVKAREHKW